MDKTKQKNLKDLTLASFNFHKDKILNIRGTYSTRKDGSLIKLKNENGENTVKMCGQITVGKEYKQNVEIWVNESKKQAVVKATQINEKGYSVCISDKPIAIIDFEDLNLNGKAYGKIYVVPFCPEKGLDVNASINTKPKLFYITGNPEDVKNTMEGMIGNMLKKPKDFNQLLVSSESGNTLAHKAARDGNLQPDWTDKKEDWLVKNKLEITIAHSAARKGILSPDWTDDPEDWLIKDDLNHTIGFIYSKHDKPFYNNPKTIEDHGQNIIDHILPIFERDKIIKISRSETYHFNIFLNPFLKKIKEQKFDDWMKTSDDYSGFLIDFVENIICNLKSNLNFEEETKYSIKMIKEIEEIIDQIQNDKLKIKEHLFKHYESKNQSIINEKEQKHDLSDTL